MIIGVGVDICGVARFAAMLARRPKMVERLFNSTEVQLPDGTRRQPASLAARFAAKEALAKALGAPVGLAWQDAEIVSEESGRPRFELAGTVLARAAALSVAHVHVSLSHDAGIASAVVVLES